VPGESTNRQSVQENIIDVVDGFNARVTDLDPAAAVTTFTSESISDVRWRFCNHADRATTVINARKDGAMGQRYCL
jgi:hypothetical protein